MSKKKSMKKSMKKIESESDEEVYEKEIIVEKRPKPLGDKKNRFTRVKTETGYRRVCNDGKPDKRKMNNACANVTSSIIAEARKIREKNPDLQWKYCIRDGSAVYRENKAKELNKIKKEGKAVLH